MDGWNPRINFFFGFFGWRSPRMSITFPNLSKQANFSGELDNVTGFQCLFVTYQIVL